MTLNLNDALGFSPFSPAFFGLLLPLQGRKSGPTLKDSRGRGFPRRESLQFGKKAREKGGGRGTLLSAFTMWGALKGGVCAGLSLCFWPICRRFRA